MTPFSRQSLVNFLNKYQKELREPVADYGGVGPIVKNILLAGEIKDYTQIDYTTGYDLLKPIKGRKYGLGICMDMLEHCSNPFIVAKNITNSLKKGALLFITAPFVWTIHEYPKDYFRFTCDGIKVLFPKLKCLDIGLASDLDKPIRKGTKMVVDRHWTTRVIGHFRR